MTIGEKIIEFNKNLKFTGEIPREFEVMNPFLNNPETLSVMEKFYHKFYHDLNKRKFIIGINPSRHGAGVTGIPFTDTKRLFSACDIEMKGVNTHEISSVFLYDMIHQYGGVKKFYKKFYINSPFPLAIIRNTPKGSLNANYYNDRRLFESVKPFMVQSLKNHIRLGLDTSEAFVLGIKNAQFLNKINHEEQLFQKLTVLEHPRYIQQYKLKEKQSFIDKYIMALENSNS